jgi:hypothetical protein
MLFHLRLFKIYISNGKQNEKSNQIEITKVRVKESQSKFSMKLKVTIKKSRIFEEISQKILLS